MLQAIGVLLLIVLGKLAYDAIKEQTDKSQPRGTTTKKKNSGKVIDLSDAWIDADNLPYKKRDYFLSARELAIWQSLNELLVGSAYIVFPKVRLADILHLAADAPNQQEYYHRVSERKIDFLICQAVDLRPEVIVMLEAITEGKKKNVVDRFTKKVTESAGIPLLTINPSDMPTNDNLHSMLSKSGLNF